MKPVVNLEEKIGKTVGRRVLRDAFTYGMQLQRSAGELLKTMGHQGFPKGVFRFRSFEEADLWMTKYQSRKTTS